MDPLHYARVSLTGWVFAAFFLLTSFEIGGPRWDAMLKFVNTSQAPLVVAVFAAIVGFGGPPAFGFLLEKIVDVSLYALRMKLRQSSAVALFYSRFVQSDVPLPTPPEAAGSFHVFFYTFADDKLVTWTRRRRGQMYACFSCALAATVAQIAAGYVFGGIATGTAVVAAIFAAALLYAGTKEYAIQRDVLSAWAKDVSISESGRRYCSDSSSSSTVAK